MNNETLRQARILMVDDEVSGLCLVQNVLNRLGFGQVRTLTDSTRFFEEFESWGPDLVITDLEMPNVDGMQIIAQLRARMAPDACLPILVLTGLRDAKIKRNALAAGATDILLKPFDSSELLMRIRNLLQTRFQHLEILRQKEDLEIIVAERTASLRQALNDLEASQRQVVQQERLRAFGEMAGGVVHDFNNSLMSIIGYSDLLLHDASLRENAELLVEYLTTINVAGQDSAHVVSRLRDFYRPREDSDVFAAVSINELLESVVPLTKPKWHGHALETGRAIRLDLQLEKVPLVFGNHAELREVLTNLVFNAVDAMPRGGVITLRTREDARGVVIEVADTGTGMTDEVRQRCLEPFFTTKAEQGTGLGLAMAFGIMRRHEGTLDIISELGRGTTIRLALPRYEPAKIESAPPQAALERSLKVLVVDDEPNVRDVVARYLLSDGHEVSSASGGLEGLEKAMAQHFDVVITDKGMPGVNGLELADALHLQNAQLPIILLTGFAPSAEERPASIKYVLKKPLQAASLRSALQEILGS